MEKNKTGKYLKYAISEILLVVIGILIALAINNWNETKKDRKHEEELLTQLQIEFENNLSQLDQKIVIRKDMMAAAFRVLDCVDYGDGCNMDNVLKDIGLTVLAPTFDPIVNDIISSGRIQFLQNVDLRQRLSFWTSEIVQVTEEEQMWMHYRSTLYVPFLLDYGIHRNVTNNFWINNTTKGFQLDNRDETDNKIGNSKKDIDLKRLLDQPKFEGLVAQSISFSKLANSQSISLRKRIVEILDIIGSELG